MEGYGIDVNQKKWVGDPLTHTILSYNWNRLFEPFKK